MRRDTTETAAPNRELRLAETDADVRRCFPVLRELRPHLIDKDDLVARVQTQRAQGYKLAFAETATGTVASVAGFRLVQNLAWGRVLYIDDLATLSTARGLGLASALMRALILHAQALGCDAIHLDSGHARHDAHRLYLNHGFRITSHHFALALEPPAAAEPNHVGESDALS